METLKAQQQQKQSAGFTLVELAIVVAIVAILAAIAIPDYLRSQAVSKRTEGILYLNQFKISEINYFMDYDTYTLSTTAIAAYGIVPDVTQLHYYGQRLLYSDDVKLGYLTIIYGQLDTDITKDTLSLKNGDPGSSWNSFAQGIAVHLDDSIL